MTLFGLLYVVIETAILWIDAHLPKFTYIISRPRIRTNDLSKLNFKQLEIPEMVVK